MDSVVSPLRKNGPEKLKCGACINEFNLELAQSKIQPTVKFSGSAIVHGARKVGRSGLTCRAIFNAPLALETNVTVVQRLGTKRRAKKHVD